MKVAEGDDVVRPSLSSQKFAEELSISVGSSSSSVSVPSPASVPTPARSALAPPRVASSSTAANTSGGASSSSSSAYPRSGGSQETGAAVHVDRLGEDSLDIHATIANVCALCGERRMLPFDLRSSFICEDVGLHCTGASRRAAKKGSFAVEESDSFLHRCVSCRAERMLPFEYGENFVCQEVGLQCIVASTARDEIDEDEVAIQQLCCVTCVWCGEIRRLPFQVDDNFVCRDVELPCNEDSASRPLCEPICNICTLCGEQRVFPFDFGGDFACADAGFDCDDASVAARLEASSHVQDEAPEAEVDGSFLHVCADCGAQLMLPFDCQENFVCGDLGLDCQMERQVEKNVYSNVCISCGSVSMCPFEIKEGFVCGCNGQPPVVEDVASLEGLQLDEESEEDVSAKEVLKKRSNERTQLMWKVLIHRMDAQAAATLFEEHGYDVPEPGELQRLTQNTREQFKNKSDTSRFARRRALQASNKKGPVKRFLNNELVSVKKNDKFVHSERESAEDKAKTSVELYILGIGRGGRHATKLPMHEKKKKGPMSHK